jgi:hypothetical protein
MTFVIVQHSDPTRKGIMLELLQRATGMKDVRVKDLITTARIPFASGPTRKDEKPSFKI